VLGFAYICYLKTRDSKGKDKTAREKKQPNPPFLYRERTLEAAHTV